MTTSPRPLEHPLLAAVRVVHGALDEVAGVDPLFMATAAKQDLLVQLTRAVTRLEALRASTLAVAEDVAAEEAARSAGAWLAAETRTSPREAAAVERVANRRSGAKVPR
jgi:hypothetical protein